MIEKSRLLSLFEKLISIDSPSFGEREMGDFVTKKLRSLGLSGLLGSTFGGSDNNYLAQRGIQGLVVATAMMFLSNWLDGFGRTGKLSISSRYLSGEIVVLHRDSAINDALRRGGVAVVRLYYEVAHYVLLTGEQDGKILMFDPYYETEDFPQENILVTLEHPLSYNRIVPVSCFNRENHDLYSLGEIESREAVLLFNERTKLTAEKTIEYFI